MTGFALNVHAGNVLDLLVTERYGPARLLPGEVEGCLDQVARRWGWRAISVPPVGHQSFWVRHWQDRYGSALGLTLHRQSITAVVLSGDEEPLLDQRTYVSAGPLVDALGADGRLIVPEAEWLAAPLTSGERDRILGANAGGWEAHSLRYWNPTSRGAALFNGWD